MVQEPVYGSIEQFFCFCKNKKKGIINIDEDIDKLGSRLGVGASPFAPLRSFRTAVHQQSSMALPGQEQMEGCGPLNGKVVMIRLEFCLVLQGQMKRHHHQPECVVSWYSIQ